MGFYSDSEFRPERAVGYLARRIHQLGQAALEPVFAGEGLTGTQWSVLAAIAVGTADTCAGLARDVAHDKGAMTRIIDQLEERGLLTRERDSIDRRVVKVSLTDAGTAVTMRCKARIVACWNGWLADWEPERVERLLGDLQQLRATLEAAVDEGGCA